MRRMRLRSCSGISTRECGILEDVTMGCSRPCRGIEPSTPSSRRRVAPGGLCPHRSPSYKPGMPLQHPEQEDKTSPETPLATQRRHTRARRRGSRRRAPLCEYVRRNLTAERWGTAARGWVPGRLAGGPIASAAERGRDWRVRSSELSDSDGKARPGRRGLFEGIIQRPCTS